ncbi:MAG: NAD(+)/NADH kinase [Thermoleophilia bacterium]|nr:NAD(+)/NADH kinase [Thermoleophilia bacterium]
MEVLNLSREMGIEVVLPESEVAKFPQAGRDGLASVVPDLEGTDVEMCLALGGDGTILRAFNRFRDMKMPILGVNFGRIGFLSGINPEEIPTILRRIMEGHYEKVDLSLLEFSHAGHRHLAINDVVVHKPAGGSVVNLGYGVDGVEMDTLRCDGIVISTPAGSTAYNLSTGGPLVSLGLDAFILTAIAPHTLRVRALVLGPGESVTITNRSIGSQADIYVDGREESGLEPEGSITVVLAEDKARLVQVTGADFFKKLRDRFIKQ